MKQIPAHWIIIANVLLSYYGSAYRYSCGTSGTDFVTEGTADIEDYPWLGRLFYPHGPDAELITSTVVLISKQMALAAALDIDKYPKHNFRSRSRVVIGRNCSGYSFKVKEYKYHPEFSKNTYSSLVMIQLDTPYFVPDTNIHPICPPPAPSRSKLTEVYAMNLNNDCSNSSVHIYKMKYVDQDECKEFYRRAELDIASLWPTHVTCARATRGGHCVWQSGTALVTRDNNNQWRLLGFGVNGPGCESAARFLDYGMYEPWVKQSIERMGRPAITRISNNHLILRRSSSSLQRFGDCDPEEIKTEIFSDVSVVRPKPFHIIEGNTVSYNLSLVTNVDYSCVVLRVLSSGSTLNSPTIRIRRLCRSRFPKCYDFSHLQIDFRIKIHFFADVEYKIRAYGQEIKTVEVKQLRKYANLLYYGEGYAFVPRFSRTIGTDFFNNATKPVMPFIQPFTPGIYATNP